MTLPESHPGYGDDRYIERREWIAAAAIHVRPGDSAPHIVYSDGDRRAWQLAIEELHGLHLRHASTAYLESLSALGIQSHRPPQLRDVSDNIEKMTGFRMTAVAGSIEARTFYESLADRNFRATQYIRHASRPGFSPEPDMIHEVLGHGPHLVNERWAHLYQLAGDAVRRLQNPAAIELVSRIFWFCVECGLVNEDGEIKVWGASLLSSVKELTQFQDASIRPLDLGEMAGQNYNSHARQPVLFAAGSQAHLEDFLGDFFATVQDDSPYAVEF
ncbi:phenylalanine 4-monooxygenase [Streptomyces sp. NPDC088190]|uniref:phenylalanine 4-monooxygenase n=1 Tax=unclassified Streptomyces TaxID=2593676 RepID=UPI002E76B483|nr:phenylalanine 4-monooxygenase [Streptomyces sp. JV190]MEE1838375.1 phenylalanine 4-monooxygenase [Streptomyces sp. JV190]